MLNLTNAVFSSININKLALAHYSEQGANQLPHIRRVVLDAAKVCRRLELPFTQEVELAAVLHDCGKGRPELRQYADHGVASAVLAWFILNRSGLDVDTGKICEAIADHCQFGSRPCSSLSAILRVADAGEPSVGFYARKSVAYCRRRGMPDTAAWDNAFGRIKQGLMCLGYGDKISFPEYTEVYSREIKKALDDASSLRSPADIADIIREYEASDCCLPADC